MKKLCWAILLLFMATTVHAASNAKIGFRAYSSATKVACAVISGSTGVTSRGDSTPLFAPVWSTARYLYLGTKGFANYSSGAFETKVLRADCFSSTSPNTSVRTKMFVSGNETRYLTIYDFLLFVNP